MCARSLRVRAGNIPYARTDRGLAARSRTPLAKDRTRMPRLRKRKRILDRPMLLPFECNSFPDHKT